MKEIKMKVSELLEKEIDIDVYDNVCEELGIAFCGPVELTETGREKFGEALDYEVVLHFYPQQTVAVVDVDGEEGVWQKKLALAKDLFESMAGFCTEDEYEAWFKPNIDEEVVNIDRGRTMELAKVNDKSLVLWEKPSGNKEYVVCSHYDSTKPVGNQWCWGHYFSDIFSATDYMSTTAYK